MSLRAQQHANIEQIMVCERLGLLQDVLLSHRDLCDRLEKGIAQDHQNALAKMLSLKKRKMQGVIRGADVCFYISVGVFLDCFIIFFVERKCGTIRSKDVGTGECYNKYAIEDRF